MAWRVFVALYSLTTDVTGSCSFLPLLYKPMEQKLLGMPCHLGVNLPIDRYLINEQRPEQPREYPV